MLPAPPEVPGLPAARDAGQWFGTFSVNRGTNDGVSVGMAVVTGDGLVGRIYEVGLNYAKVLTIIDSRSAVSCLIERTRDNGICHGSLFVNDNDEMLRMNYLPTEAVLKNNDQVVTTGSTLYPRGLLLGYITNASLDETGVAKYATLEPSCDLSQLEQIAIITEYNVQ